MLAVRSFRSVRDSAALLDATAGPALGDPYLAPSPDESFLAASDRTTGRLRIGLRYDTGLGTETHTDCRAAVDDAARLLNDLGREIIETQIDLLREEFRARYARLWSLAGTRGILAAAAMGSPSDAVAAQCEPLTNIFMHAACRCLLRSTCRIMRGFTHKHVEFVPMTQSLM